MGGIERNGVTLEMLAQEIKAMCHIECDDIATLFLQVFGEDARLLFPSVPKDTSNLPQLEKNLSSSSTKFYDYTIDPKEDSAILLSSCEGDEMAWEFPTPDGKFRELFTYALLEVFKVHPHHISNKRLVDMAAEIVTTENP
ncbi:Uncharacterized protein Fot_22790 [Forsythia ovata]|uniref:Uncharacterized protein n=1 Tax=Forsythia ovata TaxID=205694 RepID=A0ABD1UYP8_9LAMI